jgi:tetratricopeptide (TPR) repeat protein
MNLHAASLPIGVTLDSAVKAATELEKQGNLLEAESHYRAINDRYPNHFGILCSLAHVLFRRGHYDQAVQFLTRALDQEPNSAAAHTLLAMAFQNLERHEGALEHAKRAVSLNAESADAHAVLAWELAVAGRHGEARDSQARVIELAPDRPLHYYHWGEISRWTAGDPRLAALEALGKKSASLALNEQVLLHFALGKAYTDCGDIERAFRHQVEGGALQRRMLHYDEAPALQRMDEIGRAQDADWIRCHRGVGDPSDVPVFIVGMPRSGTTLIEQILASHPKVRALGERPHFSAALAQVYGMGSGGPPVAQVAVHGGKLELRRLGEQYLQTVHREAPADTARIIDKMPNNFRFVGLIHAALPHARIIHARRDAVDTCLSIFSMLFGQGQQPYSYDLGELGRYYRAYEKLMVHWRSVLPDGVMLEVQYEEVVDGLEQQTRRILAHCGLDWDDACLLFHKTDRPVWTASHAQVRQPIYRSSVRRARPPRELLLPLLEALGREPARPNAGRDCPGSPSEAK